MITSLFFLLLCLVFISPMHSPCSFSHVLQLKYLPHICASSRLHICIPSPWALPKPMFCLLPQTPPMLMIHLFPQALLGWCSVSFCESFPGWCSVCLCKPFPSRSPVFPHRPFLDWCSFCFYSSFQADIPSVFVSLLTLGWCSIRFLEPTLSQCSIGFCKPILGQIPCPLLWDIFVIHLPLWDFSGPLPSSLLQVHSWLMSHLVHLGIGWTSWSHIGMQFGSSIFGIHKPCSWKPVC